MVQKENTIVEQELGSSGLKCSLPTPQHSRDDKHTSHKGRKAVLMKTGRSSLSMKG